MAKFSSLKILKEIKAALNDCLALLKSKTPLTPANIKALEECGQKAELIHAIMQKKVLFRDTKKTEQLVNAVNQAIAAIKDGNEALQIAIALEVETKAVSAEANDFLYLTLISRMSKRIAEIQAKSEQRAQVDLRMLDVTLESLLGAEYKTHSLAQIDAALRMSGLIEKFKEALIQQEECLKRIFARPELTNPDIPYLLRFLDPTKVNTAALLAIYIQKNPDIDKATVLAGFSELTQLNAIIELAKLYLSESPINKKALQPWVEYILNNSKKPGYEEEYGTYAQSYKKIELPYENRAPYGKLSALEFLLAHKFDVENLFEFTGDMTVKLLQVNRYSTKFDSDDILKEFFRDPMSIIIKNIADSIIIKDLSPYETLIAFMNLKRELREDKEQRYVIELARKYFSSLQNPIALFELKDLSVAAIDFLSQIFPENLDLKFDFAKEICRKAENASTFLAEDKLLWLHKYLTLLEQLQDAQFVPKDEDDKKYFHEVKDRVEFIINKKELLEEDHIDIVPKHTAKSLDTLFGENLLNIIAFVTQNPAVLQEFIDAKKTEIPEIESHLISEMGTCTERINDVLQINPDHFCVDVITQVNISGPLFSHNGRLYDFDSLSKYWESIHRDWHSNGPDSTVRDPIDNIDYKFSVFKEAKYTIKLFQYVAENLDLQKKARLTNA